MSLNSDDIRKLLEYLDKDTIDNHLLQTANEEALLRERFEQYQRGEMTFHPWEEVKQRIELNLKNKVV